jgi:FkbM family methyltransferase
MNELEKWLPVVENIEPFSGYVAKGFIVDFLGCLTDTNFRTMWGYDPDQQGGCLVSTECPTVSSYGEGFFEVIDWIEAAREARETYTMMTLGACYGHQAVGAYRALMELNPMRAKLVAVEAEPGNFAWLQKNFRDNGLDPEQHWLLQCAMSDTNKPVLFPVGSSGLGNNDCEYTRDGERRLEYVREIMGDPNLFDRVASLIIDGETGIEQNFSPEYNLPARLKFVSAVTLPDGLAPFDRVDLLEADMQNSEKSVFPPAMDLIKTKVKRLHIGTHLASVLEELLDALSRRRFEIIFNYLPTTHYHTPWGSFYANDGVITARNLDL